MTLKEKLEELMRATPSGTFITIEDLAKLIDEDEDEPSDLAVEDVARLAAKAFGRTSDYTLGAVRKWIRSGVRGVRLRAYPLGRSYRVRPSDFEQFVVDVRERPYIASGVPTQSVEPEPALAQEDRLSAEGGADQAFEEEVRLWQRAYEASARSAGDDY